jgi:hypothetical protein
VNDSARTVTCRKRLRPLRFAFLVRPNDRKALLKAFEINTCLWGGCYNAIIPTYKHLPDWWFPGWWRPPTAREITLGYIDCFEPDYIVSTHDGLAEDLGLEKWRILKPDDVINAGWQSQVVHGLSVLNLYQYLFDQEIRFVQRTPLEVIDPFIRTNGFTLFSAACFGKFPSDKDFTSFGESYCSTFEAEPVRINEANLIHILLAACRRERVQGFLALLSER